MVILSLGPPTGAIDLCDLIADAMENFLEKNLQNRQNCGHICIEFQVSPSFICEHMYSEGASRANGYARVVGMGPVP